jgi:hypothetical protein
MTERRAGVRARALLAEFAEGTAGFERGATKSGKRKRALYISDSLKATLRTVEARPR